MNIVLSAAVLVLPYFLFGGYFGFPIAAANVPAVLAGAVFVFLALIMLAHRVFWPLSSRVVYTLARHGIIRRRKLLGSIGVALVGAAMPPLASVLRELAKMLGG